MHKFCDNNFITETLALKIYEKAKYIYNKYILHVNDI